MNAAECTCYPGGFTGETFDGPKPWCDVHGQPSVAYEWGQRLAEDVKLALWEQGNQEGRIEAETDWRLALEEPDTLLPEDLEVTPGNVASYIAGLQAALRRVEAACVEGQMWGAPANMVHVVDVRRAVVGDD
jgi:hypothetical protein